MGHALTDRAVRVRCARRTPRAAWLSPLAAACVLWAACAAEPGPTPEALARYVERKAAQAAAAPEGSPAPTRVRIVAVDGTGIPDYDDGPGGTDAYLIIEHEGQRFETTVAADDDPAVWGDSVIFESRPGAGLMVTLMDDDTGIDERIGVLSEPMPRVAPGEVKEIVLRYGDGARGVVRLRVEGLAAP